MIRITVTSVVIAFLIGIASAQIPRIKGGHVTFIDHHPYQVSLRLLGEHSCGGSIISEKHIMTAAHCVDYFENLPPSFFEKFFKVHTSTSYNSKKGSIYGIDKIDVHPGWTSKVEDSLANDIAIVTLRNPMEFDEKRQKINLPETEVEGGAKGIITGWGLLDEDVETETDQLQELKAIITRKAECNLKLSWIKVTDGQICAIPEVGQGVCRGDSGSPLVVKGEVVGIVSWVDEGICGHGKPDIYTNVHYYKPWIESIMNTKNITADKYNTTSTAP